MKKWIGGILGAIGIGIIVVMSVIHTKFKSAASIGIIGGSDGPTSIFIAGKLKNRASLYGIIGGAALLLIGFLLLIKKKK